MSTDLVWDTGAGWLLLRLLPPTKTAVARVQVRCDQWNQGPTINNARDLRAFGDAVQAWCHTVAAELHPGRALESG